MNDLRLTHRGWLVVFLTMLTLAIGINIAFTGKCVTWTGIHTCPYVQEIENNANKE